MKVSFLLEETVSYQLLGGRSRAYKAAVKENQIKLLLTWLAKASAVPLFPHRARRQVTPCPCQWAPSGASAEPSMSQAGE